MIHDRRQLEELEAQTLAAYARKSRDSRGRAYPEDEP
ncbi:MAG: HD domain protein, partial [Chloroflexota bacterium]